MLQIGDFRVKYGSVEAVKGVNFEVPPGKIVYLLGRNGAGKTSILRGVMGMAQTEGIIRFDGVDISRMPTYIRANLGIGYVPERKDLFPNLTVKENLELFMTGGKWTTEKVFELFPGLAKLEHRKAGTLSGGEQEMVSIGRALMRSPKLLLLDEPFEGLAPIVVKVLEKAFSQIKGQMSILMTEQNEKSAIRFADVVLKMERGTLIKSKGDLYALDQEYIGKSV